MLISNNFNNVNSFQGKKNSNNEKIGFVRGALGVTTALATNQLVAAAYNGTISRSILNKISKINPKAEDNIREAIQTAFDKSKIGTKGAQIIDITKMKEIFVHDPATGELKPKNVFEQLKDQVIGAYKTHPSTKIWANQKNKFSEKLLENIGNKVTEQIIKGENAYCLNLEKIIINPDKCGYAAFHEIGHIVNKNFSKLGKTLQAMKIPSQALASMLLLTSLLTNKRTEEHPSENKWQKGTQFIKNNIGKISALLFTPILAEEALASIRGQKMAKSLLPKNSMKAVTKVHALSLASYTGLTLLAGISAYITNKVRDRIVHGKNC